MKVLIKTRSFRYLISEEERLKLISQILKSMNSLCKVEEKVRLSTSWEGRHYRYYEILCPCGSLIGGWRRIWCDEKGNYTKENYQRQLWWAWQDFFVHLRYHIRMNGSDLHIRILIKILGEKLALKYLETWAKKNVLVAIKLQSIVNELKEKEQEKING